MSTRTADLLLAVAFCVTTVAGCRSAAPSPYETPSEVSRSTVEAEALSRKGADLVGEDQREAEKILREALTRDLYYGPAHNNLGVLYLKQEKLYEAANEFEWARKLMPGHPDPRVNLALTLEMAGKVEEALASYGAALEVYPEYLPAVQGIASLTLKAGKKDERLSGWLDTIAMRSESPKWREWALARAR
ncbi:MAG: tetratricopeptide repeat protein [Planctomycetota bacterium]